MQRLKNFIKKVPILRELARYGSKQFAKIGQRDFDSTNYWEQRYIKGKNSGPGSYNQLARFKAEVLNQFVEKHGVQSVLELGSGDGAQLALADYPEYLGVDVSRTIIEQVREKFADQENLQFLHLEDVTNERAELTLSLDVIYHLIEDQIFSEHLTQLFDRADRFVIIYSSNTDDSADSVHVRHRRFTDWVAANRSEFELLEKIPNRHPFDLNDQDSTSFADFYIYGRQSA
ncbi:MAG TPA: hypothetical protein DCS24_00625 [Erythrobacter sp.]|nr:hypothetical protein [Erythrobacter sp.]